MRLVRLGCCSKYLSLLVVFANVNEWRKHGIASIKLAIELCRSSEAAVENSM